jgi:hypothetical protein
MQKAARRRRYLRNKRKKAFKRMMLYTGLAVVGLILVWHPVSASTLQEGTSTPSPSSTPSKVQSSVPSASSAASTVQSGSQQAVIGAGFGKAQAGPIDMLNQSFGAIHAKQTGYILHDYSTVNHQFTEVKNLSNFGRDLVQELGIQNAKITEIPRADDVFYNVDGIWPNQTEVHVTLSSFRNGTNALQMSNSATGSGTTHAENASGITTLAVSVIGKGPYNENIKQQYQMVENMVKRVGVTPEMDACLEGYLDDRIVGVQAKDIINQSFAAIHAAPVEGLYTALETSVSGYTNDYSTNNIATDGKRMNVQFAVHADDYYHRTNVLVGTPIITTTY